MACSKCNNDYKAFQGNTDEHTCDSCCDECKGECPIGPECECPIRLFDKCVHFTGCELYDLGIREGDNMNEVITKFNHVIRQQNKRIFTLKDMIEELQDKMTDMAKRVQNVEKTF